MDVQANPLETEHTLCVVLPGGQEGNTTVHGSKPLMDLFVSLCAKYHLNPSDYTMEVLSPNKNVITFKPNSPVGLLGAEKLVLKPKALEKTTPKPYMPATVLLLVNYRRAHRTVVRVSPRLPLETILPIVCDKCEFNVESTVLLKDSRSEEPLDLGRSLNEHGLREVFAKDTAAINQRANSAETREKQKKQKENPGFLSLFGRRKNKLQTDKLPSAPLVSPAHGGEGGSGPIANGISSSKTLPLHVSKKRRAAPPPPITASQSVPDNLSRRHVEDAQTPGESTLKRTKRRAPAPPCAPPLQEQQAHTDGAVTVESPKDPTEGVGSERVTSSESSTPPSQPEQGSGTRAPSLRGQDLTDARSALARVLMSSVSKSSLVKRLSHSGAFTELHNGSSSLRRPDDGDFCQELESVLNANLPTENKWEELEGKRRLTTFRVSPPKKESSPNSDITPTTPELSHTLVEVGLTPEASPDVQSSETTANEDSTSPECRSEAHPNGSEIGSPNFEGAFEVLPNSESPPVSPQSEVEGTADGQADEELEVTTEETVTVLAQSIERVSTRGDDSAQTDPGCSSRADEQTFSSTEEEKRQQEEEDDEEEADFPPPPPPVFFSELTEVTVEASPPPCPASCKDSGLPNDQSPSTLPKRSTSFSRFAQAVTMAVQRSRLQTLRKGYSPQQSVGSHQTTPSTYQFGT